MASLFESAQLTEKMLLPLCNWNCHQPFLPFKPLSKPSFQIPCPRFPISQFKPFRRRASISAVAVHTEAISQSAIRRIAEKLRSLGYVEESSKDTTYYTSIAGPNSPGEIFVPLPTRLPKYRVGNTMDPSWSTPENPVPEPGSGNSIQRFHELRRGVMEEEEKERIRQRSEGKRHSAPSMAELTLSEEELGRLRTDGIQLKKKLKVGKAGITEGIVNGIHERWRRSELVKITCEDICRLNMKRTHELLERKTGGLVVWRSGSNIILYRGPHYKYPYFQDDGLLKGSSSKEFSDIGEDPRLLNGTDTSSPIAPALESSGVNSGRQISHPTLVQGVGFPHRVRFQLPGEADLTEEANALLEGLGPRFNDWWGYDPLPIDADLLPAVVPGYKRPFRLLPYGVKPKLTNDELNTLRRLGRPLPCHFALGRNRKHQGLAASIIKLWEKCEIAKLAVKRGVQNTNSELMAEELKRLTGGILLSRDKEFIVLYRGKDFLPTAVSSAIEERRKYGIDVSKTSGGNLHLVNQKRDICVAKEYVCETGRNEETNLDLRGTYSKKKLLFSEAATERTAAKLSMALAKKAKAEKFLEKLEENEIPQTPEIDKEGITEEERYMLRRVGLRMKPFLLLGRRGVFDGTVENMHLHWKYRELVKVCIGMRSMEEVHRVARTLEAESGGILVAVEQVNKGYDIIMYRGKNYKRPASLRPRTLLSKREAMKRSLEAQRRESLKLHILKLDRTIDQMKHVPANDEDINDVQLATDIRSASIEQGTRENHTNDGEISQTGRESDCTSSFDMRANEARESHGTNATPTSSEDPVSTPKDYVHIIQQDLPGNASLLSAVPNNYLFDATDADLQGQSIQNETRESLNINERMKNTALSHNLRLDNRTSSPNTAYIQVNPRGKDPIGGVYKSAPLELSFREATSEGPRVTASRSLQLSNRERLLLRKQALCMKKRPVLAVGKSNVISGVAKTIKEHFRKYPLAIVNIKGRAKGTSIQEVIYNLEQATGAILVSQEPSKVILYRGWGSGAKPGEACGKVNNSSAGREVKTWSAISSELISAIRLECGLRPIDEEGIGSDSTAEDIPYDN